MPPRFSRFPIIPKITNFSYLLSLVPQTIAMLLRSKRTAVPLRFDSDTVVPMHFWDDVYVNRDFTLCWTLRFSQVLDPDKVHHALVRLLGIGDWRKLGARIRLNVRELRLPCHRSECSFGNRLPLTSMLLPITRNRHANSNSTSLQNTQKIAQPSHIATSAMM